jgi:hypothetical protein
VHRGTSNSNARGSSEDRRRRVSWLLKTYAADVRWQGPSRMDTQTCEFWDGRYEPACRCYRCGKLLTRKTVTVDRIVPGCKGGRYVRSNIRPACSRCNSETGGRVRS